MFDCYFIITEWLVCPFPFQLNHVRFGTRTKNTPFSRNYQRNGRSNGYYLLTKANISVEADVLAKDTVSVESVDDKNGNS